MASTTNKARRAIALTAMTWSALGGAHQAIADEAILYTWADFEQPPFIDTYIERFGAPPETAIFADEDEAFARMRAGFEPNVMGPCTYEVPRWVAADLLEPIDVTRLRNWDKIPPSLQNLPGMMISETEAWFVPQYWGNTSVMFRTDLAPEYVENPSWDILWDPAYAGRVAVMQGVDDTVSFVAHYLGYDPYALTEAQWSDVQDSLRALVANTRMISSDPTTLQQAMASGELVAAMAWNDNFTTLKNEGHPIAYMRPETGIFTWVCGFTVHAGTEDLDRAYELIDAGIETAAGVFLLEEWGYGPANAEPYGLVDPHIVNDMGIGLGADGLPGVDAFLASGIFQETIPNKDRVVQTWAEIQAGL